MQRILLVRHAECEMNLHLADKVGGQANYSPLTDLGVCQAQALGADLLARNVLIGRAFSSTAIRSQETARLLFKSLQRPTTEVTVSAELLELDQGEWEGQPRGQCYTSAALEAIAADAWNFAAPGGESQHQVEDRMQSYILHHVLPCCTQGGPPALVVSHGLAIKCFLRWILDSKPIMTRKVRLDNTSITEVGWVSSGLQQGWHVLRVNDTAHLLENSLNPAAP